ncbi:segregation and condensation protein A [Fictibacillus phosphorivorans]|uniref:Segregation and condensation protein A n=1 Tax=Fictibacillus phosphorivorans TaxID=1221500 RepID=A0A163R771_9BACL|nr:segregation/condensation protein A [Fictibacillus phosphorivorans]KZE66295.1 segregation and condensation protein A [Fictibacillus phosphorivorans]
MQYSVKLDGFEGPLDLLLHLIQTYEVDIYDIPVAIITEQYLQYIHTMKELKLDVASEFLVMAATLLAIKSKMLLPKHEEELFENQMELEMEEDPRDELVRRLVEYRKYKHAADELKERESQRSLVYTRQPLDLSQFEKEETAKQVTNVTLYDMLQAMQKVFQEKVTRAPRTTIERQEIPIETRMEQIKSSLQSVGGRKKFTELFDKNTKEHVVVTFLAILELMKVKSINCEQQDHFSEIYITMLEE